MLDLLYRRRSIRKFLDKRVEKRLVDKIVQGLLLSPSGKGKRPWEFVVVDNTDILLKLSESKAHGSAFLKGAPLAVVVLGKPEDSDTWIEDTSIASTLCLLVAESLGLGACWIQIRGREHEPGVPSESYIGDILNIPVDYSVESIIAVGYPAETLPLYKKDDLMFDKVHRNVYGTTVS